MARRFSMNGLRTLVAKALAESDYQPSESARIRAVPDTRTIRYYTTLGLLSPPTEMRGRTALYDERHVQQVVAIKRLQAQDVTLSDIQQRLVGLPPAKVAAIADLPEAFWQDAESVLEPTQQPRADVDERLNQPRPFWAVPAALPGDDDVADVDGAVRCDAAKNEAAKNEAAITSGNTTTSASNVYTAIRLQLDRLGVTLELPAEASLPEHIDLDALRMACRPLLKELRRQRLMDD